ncbi:AAA family ATPase [Mesorhizobium sp. M2D.F.Ca.ET.185.01.1.1]|uniref:ATP-dependent Clp protease adaptor ClpS n=1 Tax=unclassified Mesorhizobium TaxID=325217 RepID=UPI000FCAFF84|nr:MULTISPECIES: ATP-dependent Clp protease adaptor ClpS [unclassified Mesorhizobium]TGP81956.1 AAA family ATPase [bacterium M00.F.Ca.ET.227.01.1.1]TGP92152.1 AAA family ATPase [bacterium M00.F.Ca.ET.221.01.1.1]TGP95063.1 AAA family ATPase [bacterium M00.F.Ca.ET.222.01.1.1]TGU09831.1 AAA family ATPase [bacterium M00.F.Ca.ET.163.01.1.1]TGU39015.1 AAA family ATPase [bacterium M00.F.Ca.ET.156.01.1.1]TGU47647.1 AAA family ATPase [bacterium M00.F.Ca.ET.146.01.1.1]TGV69645.1 AAA family ATPase [Mes
MRHTSDDSLQLVIHNDDQTPWAFVVDLIRSVFSRSQAEAEALTATISQQGEAVCGSYPSAVAKAMLETAEQRIRAAGHPLCITVATGGGTDAVAPTGRPTQVSLRVTATSDGAAAAIGHPTQDSRDRKFKYAHEAIAWHFSGLAHDEIIATSRQFPGHMRADVQVALDKLFSASPIRFFGLYEQHRYETLTYAALTKDGQYAVTISAAQFQEVDIGESEPVKCLNNGLWLNRDGDLHYAVVLSFHREYGREAGTCVEIAVPAGEAGVALVDRCFAQLEAAINAARSYRGKVLSLETEGDYQGRSKGVMVHRLPQVQRDAVILPEQTLRLLDRNVIRFIESREALRRLGQSTRKGILLYGPPGTGKTHTIRYLAANLPGHTTLIITAGQMGLLSQYMTLARLLQPTTVVIEDVDLIARDRETMGSPCEESLLNTLLNEMDGLKDNADILFVLTTNRPEQLEGALTGRPGRIDQAIEVPLPDDVCREKLVRLYGGGLKLPDEIVSEAVARTKGVSAAFIKELMRRAAQTSIMQGDGEAVTSSDLAEALDDMLFTGGRLNVRLLGGATEEISGY